MATRFFAQSPFERLPGEPHAQKIPHRQNQKAPIGLVQAAGSQEGEIGHQGPKLGLALDAAKEVGMGGMTLHDHRGALALAVVHEYVYLIFAQVVFLMAHHHLHLGGNLLGGETLVVFAHILAHLLQKDQYLPLMGIAVGKLVEKMPHRAQHHLLVHLGLGLVVLLFQGRHLAQALGDLGLDAVTLLP